MADLDPGLIDAIVEMWVDGYATEVIADQLFLDEDIVLDVLSRKEYR